MVSLRRSGARALPMEYFRFTRQFQGMRFDIAAPRHRPAFGRKFHVLVSQHGTRDEEDDAGAAYYLDIPFAHDDPYRYDLLVIAPQFPASSSAAAGQVHGANFHRFDKDGLQIIHDFLHIQLAEILAEPEVEAEVHLTGKIDLSKFYFFGHSRGGMTVHTYVMRFQGYDIHRAASCGAVLLRRDSTSTTQFNQIPDFMYLGALDAFLRTNVASVIGTAEERGRIESIRQYICREVGQRTALSTVQSLLSAPPVELSGPAVGARLSCDQFDTPLVIPEREPRFPDVNYRFIWNPNGTHRGRINYPVARKYLFADRRPRWLFDAASHTRAGRALQSQANGAARRLEEQIERDHDAEDLG